MTATRADKQTYDQTVMSVIAKKVAAEAVYQVVHNHLKQTLIIGENEFAILNDRADDYRELYVNHDDLCFVVEVNGKPFAPRPTAYGTCWQPLTVVVTLLCKGIHGDGPNGCIEKTSFTVTQRVDQRGTVYGWEVHEQS